MIDQKRRAAAPPQPRRSERPPHAHVHRHRSRVHHRHRRDRRKPGTLGREASRTPAPTTTLPPASRSRRRRSPRGSPVIPERPRQGRGACCRTLRGTPGWSSSSPRSAGCSRRPAWGTSTTPASRNQGRAAPGPGDPFSGRSRWRRRRSTPPARRASRTSSATSPDARFMKLRPARRHRGGHPLRNDAEHLRQVDHRRGSARSTRTRPRGIRTRCGAAPPLARLRRRGGRRPGRGAFGPREGPRDELEEEHTWCGTGYGPVRLPFPKDQIRSEILCHGLGAPPWCSPEPARSSTSRRTRRGSQSTGAAVNDR